MDNFYGVVLNKSAGGMIGDTVIEAIEIAKQLKSSVKFTFNGIELTCYDHSNADEICDIYFAKMTQNRTGRSHA